MPTSNGGRGADVPFTEYAAVGAATNGTMIAPSYNLYTLPAEAVGRTAVTLSGSGEYVEFTLARPANAVDLRYSIPDSADGAGLTTPLNVSVDGHPSGTLTLTSKYSWFYGSYPFTNNPADQHGHHMYDDVRTMFGRTLPAGTRVRFQPGDASVPVTINVADFEHVAPPRPEPDGALSVLSFGANPSGQTDSTTAIQNAINAGEQQHRPVYLPPGDFTVTGHLIVNDVTLTGAGEWYSVLHGAGVGVYGQFPPTPSTNVHLSNFAIFGEVQDRVDSAGVNGIGGAMGGGSTIDNVWIQHTKAGMWFDGPFDGLTIRNVRIQDTTADGINFDGGITHSQVENSFVRNTGDDGLALWSSGAADAGDTFRHDTVELPILANNFAIYGGHDNAITWDYGTDTVTQGGGIQVGNRFAAVPLSGTTTIDDNTLVRAGTLDPNWRFGVGAIWFYASDENMTGTINVDDNTILDSPYDAFGFVGDYIPNATPPAEAITNVNINGATVKNVGTFVVQLQSAGSAYMANVKATGVGLAGQMACGYGIALTQGPGNTGWSSSQCAFPTFNILSLSTSSLSFGLLNQNVQSASQTITVTNPGPGAASIPSVSATGGFSETNDCPSSLPAGASCTVNVYITPTAVQTYSGLLVVNADTPFAPYTVSLSGAVYNPNGNLAATAIASADSTLAGFPASNANDGDQATYWQAAGASGSLELSLAEPATVDRLVLKLPQGWGDRDQTIAVEASTDGTNWTPVLAPQAYLFSANNAAGNNVVDISIPPTAMQYIRLAVSDNTVQGAPQIAEFEVYSN
ncbi:MAG: discoidin domain-containing protein [Acidobacteriota bacterium]|nr:discoidin domain-containing protein [Acidobacteriota bacterium]